MPSPEASIRKDPETRELWCEFRSIALVEGKTTRQALVEAIKLWLEREKERRGK